MGVLITLYEKCILALFCSTFLATALKKRLKNVYNNAQKAVQTKTIQNYL
jgi:hypothetical protein